MAISIQCPFCSKRFIVNDALSGKRVKCNKCGKVFRANGVMHVGSPQTSTSSPSGHARNVGKTTDGGTSVLVQTLIFACVLLLGSFSVSIICLIHGGIVPGLMLLLLAGLSGVVLACVVRLFLARSHAFGTHTKEMDIFFGLVKLVLWNPSEGVVFLRNKYISHVHDNPHGGGGVRFIIPMLGDEVAMRADLTVHRTEFEDKNVRTLDGLLLTIRGNVRWGIRNLEKYYLYMSKETHNLNDRGLHDIGTSLTPETAERSLARMIESQTRTLVSQSTLGPLLAKVPANTLMLGNQPVSTANTAVGHAQLVPTTSGPPAAVCPNVFCSELKQFVTPTADQDGLQIREIEVQEVLLPAEIERLIVDLYEMPARAELTARAKLNESLYLPQQAELSSRAKQIELEALAKVLGTDGLTLKEVLKSMKGMSFLGVPDFIQRLFTDLMKTKGEK